MSVTAALASRRCGSSGSSKSSPSNTPSSAPPTTLHIAFAADMQVPDPDIFYEVEGNEVVTSVYEGLVRYKPDSSQLVPALATSWTVSPDGMTYTFKLRPGREVPRRHREDAAAVEATSSGAPR